jgi:hypothetical protein
MQWVVRAGTRKQTLSLRSAHVKVREPSDEGQMAARLAMTASGAVPA